MSDTTPINIHPSQFANNANRAITNDQMKSTRTLLTLTDERSKMLGVTDISKLKSPGNFDDTQESKQTGSNTRFLFKNLYGETLLTYLFFSEENIENLQKLIRMLVFKEMKQVVDYQSRNDLMIVMRSIFLELSEHPELIDETTPAQKRQELLKAYTEEVDRLNQLVLNWVVPKVCSGLQQYLGYLRDSMDPVKPMEAPVSTNISGTRQYRSVTSVLTGNNL
jgi:hypothetical protein